MDAGELTDHYRCPSYIDDDGQLRDCECGKCEQLIKENK